MANSPDPDETPRYAASHLDPSCLQRSSQLGFNIARINNIPYTLTSSESSWYDPNGFVSFFTLPFCCRVVPARVLGRELGGRTDVLNSCKCDHNII